MTGLTVLVVDDEPLARRRVTRLLQKLAWVQKVEEAGDVEEALERAAACRPDILLLDIQMPGGDGFRVMERLAPPLPAVVFVTAFDHYALRAFDASAVDYVTKPIEPGRFEQALQRARVAAESGAQAERLDELRETVASLKRAIAGQSRRQSEFWVRRQGEYLKIAPEDIIRFQADRDYVRLHVAGADYLYQESLTSLESRLDRDAFLRIHRSTIVRRSAIARIRPAPFASLIVVLTDGTELRVGRTYTHAIRASLAPSAD